ncbi:hypothetical protein ACFL5S_01230 [Fibrobacterota bacterium]
MTKGIINFLLLFPVITAIYVIAGEGNSMKSEFSRYEVIYRYTYSVHQLPIGEYTEVTIKNKGRIKIEWQRREPKEYPVNNNQESKVTKNSKKEKLSRDEETAFRNLLKKIDLDELKSKYEDTTLIPMQANYSTFSSLEIKLDDKEKKIEIIDESAMPEELKEIYDYLVKFRDTIKKEK